MFHVRLQQADVLKDFDIVREAGGPRKAVVREFKGIRVKDYLNVTLTPAGGGEGNVRLPILSALEVRAE